MSLTPHALFVVVEAAVVRSQPLGSNQQCCTKLFMWREDICHLGGEGIGIIVRSGRSVDKDGRHPVVPCNHRAVAPGLALGLPTIGGQSQEVPSDLVKMAWRPT